MTITTPTDAALVAAHKAMAQRLRARLPHYAPQAQLSHVQALHVVATLHGVPTWQTLQAHPDRSLLPDAPACTAAHRALADRNVHIPPLKLAQLLSELPLPLWRVLEEEVYDVPMKTQVAVSIVLEGRVTEISLRNLLQAEYDRVQALTGFRFHPQPTAIFTWAYPSEAHHQGGAGQWAGMVQRSHSDFMAGRAPEFTIKTSMLNALQEPEITRFGLPESMRRVIFLDHCRVTNRARLEADAAHPIGAQNTLESVGLNQDFKRARLKAWNALLATQHGITPEQLDQLIVEGLTAHWPIAPLWDTQTQTVL